jgi:hypothetical protein
MGKTLVGIALNSLLWLALGLLSSSATLAQSAGAKAYAPEDLSVLSVPERIRVIDKEYAEQSRGRRIPDDQLEFYLDQIQSGWRFSQIKQDIALSLGSNGGWRPGPGQLPSAPEVLCESRDGRYAECTTQFRGAAMVSRQLSSVRCTEGVNFGSRPGRVWVNNGCRARFVEDTRYSSPSYPDTREIACESRNGQYQECRTGFMGRATLSQQTSSTACIEGRTWGARTGLVWVNGGCRGRFAEDRGGGRPGGSGYAVTCESQNGRFQACRWDDRNGRPYLLEQTSGSACIEGRTWGYDRREGLWVDRGCRGRFGGTLY